MTEATTFITEQAPSDAPASVLGQWIERAMSLDMLAAVPAPQRARFDPFVARERGVVGYGMAGVNSTMLNRIFIGGEGIEPSARAVERVLTRFAERGVRAFFAHVATTAATPDVLGALRASAIERYPRAWVKLARQPGSLPVCTSGFTVREAALEDAAAFADLVVRCHGAAPEARPLLAALVGRARWHVYVACAGERLIATGALLVLGDVGYLTFGATEPDFRGRGAQSALLEKRLRVAFALGCRWVFSDTGEAVAGRPNPSFDNMVRLGLRPLERRENYAPAGAKWT